MTRDEFIQKAAIALAGNPKFCEYGRLNFTDIENNATALADRMCDIVDFD